MKSQFATLALEVHVSFADQIENLHKDDISIPGVYATKVDASLPEGLAAWAALQAFRENVRIAQPGDFNCKVFDPEVRRYISEVLPQDAVGVFHEYCGKVAEDIPRTTLRLTLDVSYLPNSFLSVDVLKELLVGQVERAVQNGMLTGYSCAEVDKHAYDVDEVLDEPEALKAVNLLESSSDYKLRSDVQRCWIEVDTASVCVMRTDEGVIVDILATDGKPETLASAQISYNDLEGEIVECLGVDIDDVRLQYEYAHPNGPAFDSLDPVDRAAYIKEVAAATAKVAAAIASSTGENSDDDTAPLDLARMFTTAAFR